MIREGSGAQRAGEVDWRARELLEEAIRARQAGQLPGESLDILRQRLRAATTMAELDAVAAQIPPRTSDADVGARGPPSSEGAYSRSTAGPQGSARPENHHAP